MAIVPVPPMAIAERPALGGLRRALLGERSWWAGLPLWLALAAVPLTLATYALGTIALRRDWADGAQIASGAVAVIIVVVLVAGAVLLIRRSAQPLMAALTGALLLVLAVSGVGALVGQPVIHDFQAGSLEHDREWTAAIHEYTLAGEQPPHAPNIAHVHLEWGEDLLLQAKYRDAVSFFYIAQGDDTESTSVAERANRDLNRSYRLWFAADIKTFPYASAATFLTRYQSSADCDASCKQDTHLLVAQIKYTQAHGVYLPTSCSLALPIYQDLATNYSDTTYGVQAIAALAAPVDVTISIAGVPVSVLASSPVAHFSSRLYPLVLDQIQYFSDDYAAMLDRSGGLTFYHVLPGNYNLSVNQSDGSRWYWSFTSPFDPYTEVVQPLCGPTVTIFDW